MLTYTPPKNSALPTPTEKPWLLLLLAFAWLWPGILGHDPWKPDEPYITAIVQHMLNSGDWLLPLTAGKPYLESSPLYYWVAASFAKLFSPWLLSLHDAARLATPFFMSITLLCAGCAGRVLIGRRHGRSVVLILIGSIGLIVLGHQMSSAIAGLAGFSLALLALSLSPRTPGRAATLLALAFVVVFLSTNLLELTIVLLLSLLLPAFFNWRNKNHFIAVFLALCISLPLMFIWPHALAKAHPAEFNYWWNNHAFGFLPNLKLNFLHNIFYYPNLILWFCWPAWPLAMWTLYRRKSLDSAMLQLPILMLALSVLMFTISGHFSTEMALPLLLPMAMLAAVEIDSLRRGAAALFNWFGLMTFGLFGLLIWFCWLAINFSWSTKLTERSVYFSKYYQPHISIFYLVCALLATVIWVWALSRKNLRGRQALTNWAAGVTLLCGLLLTLGLPWLDAAKSFRPVVNEMVQHMPTTLSSGLSNNSACIAVEADDTIARINWEYYANIQLKPYNRDQPAPCDWQIITSKSEQQLNSSDWQLIWQGNRPRDNSNVFHLYQHISLSRL